jgi:aspartate ammonia-lyase
LCIQHFVVDLHQETKQKQNVMQLKDLTIGSVIKYTDIENPGAEYVVLGQAFESYINILCKETNNIEPMHAMTPMVGKRWEIVAKA